MKALYKSTYAEPIYFGWKLNPIWWFGNTDEPEPPDWYKPGAGKVKRFVFWYLRNPIHNFTSYVAGELDRDHYVLGTGNPLDTDQPGVNVSLVCVGRLPLLPFISCNVGRVVSYLGWRPDGKLGAKFKIRGH